MTRVTTLAFFLAATIASCTHPSAWVSAYRQKYVRDWQAETCLITREDYISEEVQIAYDVAIAYFSAIHPEWNIVTTSRHEPHDLHIQVSNADYGRAMTLMFHAYLVGDDRIDLWDARAFMEDYKQFGLAGAAKLSAVALSRFDRDLDEPMEMPLATVESKTSSELIAAAEEYQSRFENDYEKAFEELKNLE